MQFFPSHLLYGNFRRQCKGKPIASTVKLPGFVSRLCNLLDITDLEQINLSVPQFLLCNGDNKVVVVKQK